MTPALYPSKHLEGVEGVVDAYQPRIHLLKTFCRRNSSQNIRPNPITFPAISLS